MTIVTKIFKKDLVSCLFIGIKPGYRRSCRNLGSIAKAADMRFTSENTFQEFLCHYNKVAQDVISNKLVSKLPRINERLENILEHNVPNGRKIRASLIIGGYQIMRRGENISLEDMEKLFSFCWGYEMFIAAYIIQDDIVDNTPIRRGEPAWYKQVGLDAINDSLLLEAANEKLIKKYFGNHKNYLEIMEEYMDCRRLTRTGQLLESIIDEFTIENYSEKAYHKMTTCTFETPLKLCTLLLCKENILQSKEAMDVIKEIGLIYTIMNDYLDCYEEKYFRKTGTDIQQNYCTWLILTALERANAEQKKILKTCYGSHEERKLQKVKQVYEELKIYEAYEIGEKQSYDRVMKLLKNVSDKEAHYLLNEIIKIVYRKN